MSDEGPLHHILMRHKIDDARVAALLTGFFGGFGYAALLMAIVYWCLR